MDLVTRPNVDVATYSDACPSVVQSSTVRRNVMYYECCPEPYIDILVNLKLAWR